MKSLKCTIAFSGILALLATLSFSACTNKNDWDVDDSYARLFTVTSMSVTTRATEIDFTWTTVPDTEYYIIEICKDSLTDAWGMGERSGSVLFGEDKSIVSSPVTLAGLDSNSSYCLRVKAISSTLESKWGYLDDYWFKTKSEQIMSGISSNDITATTVYAQWTAGATVTHIELVSSGTVIRTITLTAAQLEEGAIIIEELNPSTAYTINLYNDDTLRGYGSFVTFAEAPDADKVIYLGSDDVIDQDFFDEIAAGSDQSVTIVFPANSAYYYSNANENNLILPDGISFTFYGLPGGEKPILGVKQFTLGSSHGFLKFENMEITGLVGNEDGSTSQVNYWVNQSAVATIVGSIEFSNCIIHDFGYSLLRLQDASYAKAINSLVFDNCVIYNIGLVSPYSLIHVDAGSGVGRVDNITITNSTIRDCVRGLLYNPSYNPSGAMAIKDCTFSRMVADTRYFIDFGSTSFGPANGLAIQNCIFGSTRAAAARGIRGAAYTTNNCYATTDWVTGSNAISGFTSYNGTEADLFVDPANNDYTISDVLFSGKRSCGDPRWYLPE